MDDVVDPELKDDELDEELDADGILGEKKPKLPKDLEDDSLDALADEEEEILPEDAFDDIDLW
ncbi:hypothetical protein H0W91_01815 [Patescibacteria group bacterium]|nr:hypothetical protein [Patescibacteria group bacterium]